MEQIIEVKHINGLKKAEVKLDDTGNISHIIGIDCKLDPGDFERLVIMFKQRLPVYMTLRCPQSKMDLFVQIIQDSKQGDPGPFDMPKETIIQDQGSEPEVSICQSCIKLTTCDLPDRQAGQMLNCEYFKETSDAAALESNPYLPEWLEYDPANELYRVKDGFSASLCTICSEGKDCVLHDNGENVLGCEGFILSDEAIATQAAIAETEAQIVAEAEANLGIGINTGDGSKSELEEGLNQEGLTLSGSGKGSRKKK